MNFNNFNDYLKRTAPTMGIQIRDVPNVQYTMPPKINKVNTELKITTIVADSRDRNRTVYPNCNQFKIKGSNTSVTREDRNTFAQHDEEKIPVPVDISVNTDAAFEYNFKNVKEIKLEECIVPNFSNFYPYLVMQIPELQNILYGTNDNLRNGFAILMPERKFGPIIDIVIPTEPEEVDGEIEYQGSEVAQDNAWINCKTPQIYCKKIFDPPLAKLPTMTIEYCNPDGDLFDFDLAIPPYLGITADPKNETMAVFKLCSENTDKHSINYSIIP